MVTEIVIFYRSGEVPIVGKTDNPIAMAVSKVK